MKKTTLLSILSIIIVSCYQDDKHIKKEYNDPSKILNIENVDTNNVYVCLFPNTYQYVSIALDSVIIFRDSNFVNDFVPAKLIFSARKSAKKVKLKVRIDNNIDTIISQTTTGIYKIMVGKNFENNFYYRTNLEPAAWVVD